MKDKKHRFISVAVSLMLSIALVVFGIGCRPDHGTSDKPPIETDSITVFLTGNILSTLKPCGCSENQLGGLDRRHAVIDTAGREKRMVIDTGNLLRDISRQDEIKFVILFQAMAMLEYDLVNLDKTDLQVARQQGLLDVDSFGVITAPSDESAELGVGSVYSKTFKTGQNKLQVTVASINTESGSDINIEKLFPKKSSGIMLNILISDSCQSGFVDMIAQKDIVDVIICPATGTEPALLNREQKEPLLITTGRLGEYFGRLKAAVMSDNSIRLDYQKFPVLQKASEAESHPIEEALLRLYEDYKLQVKDENLLAAVPKFPLPDGLEYTGSDSCQACHEYEFEEWSSKSHAHAYQTLAEVNSQYDPECVKCHVIGLEYKTGFESEKSPEDLRNVGCEVCHGPGSKHISSVLMGGKVAKTSDPKYACTDCHTPEHSVNYSGNEQEYLKKIKHWREPKSQ